MKDTERKLIELLTQRIKDTPSYQQDMICDTCGKLYEISEADEDSFEAGCNKCKDGGWYITNEFLE